MFISTQDHDEHNDDIRDSALTTAGSQIASVMLFSVTLQSVFGEILKLNNCCSFFLNKISTITLVTRLHSLITSHYRPELYLISGRNLSVGERAEHRRSGSVWSFFNYWKNTSFFFLFY